MGTMTNKQANDELRKRFLEDLILHYKGNYEVLRTGSNQIVLPVINSIDNEEYIRITISIPTGSKDEPYDGHEEEEFYFQKLENDYKKAEEKKETKKKKIERDKKRRKKAKEEKEKEE